MSVCRYLQAEASAGRCRDANQSLGLNRRLGTLLVLRTGITNGANDFQQLFDYFGCK